jgi:hypothetical protein
LLMAFSRYILLPCWTCLCAGMCHRISDMLCPVFSCSPARGFTDKGCFISAVPLASLICCMACQASQ